MTDIWKPLSIPAPSVFSTKTLNYSTLDISLLSLLTTKLMSQGSLTFSPDLTVRRS